MDMRHTVEKMTMAITMSSSDRNSDVCHRLGSMMNGKNEQMAIMPTKHARAAPPSSTFRFLRAFILLSSHRVVADDYPPEEYQVEPGEEIDDERPFGREPPEHVEAR